jgi:hypothetical protein
MSQRERAFKRPREGDLEKRLRPEYKEYEDWRTAQAGATPVEITEQKKPQAKKAFLGKWDLVFIVLGVLAGLVYQSCKAAP